MGKKGLLLNTPEHLKRIRVIAPAPKKEKPKTTEKRATGAMFLPKEEGKRLWEQAKKDIASGKFKKKKC